LFALFHDPADANLQTSYRAHLAEGETLQDVSSAAVPENCPGSFGGIQNCFGYLGGALVPALTGFAVQVTGSFTTPLLIGAVISLIGVEIEWAVPRDPITANELLHVANILPSLLLGMTTF